MIALLRAPGHARTMRRILVPWLLCLPCVLPCLNQSSAATVPAACMALSFSHERLTSRDLAYDNLAAQMPGKRADIAVARSHTSDSAAQLDKTLLEDLTQLSLLGSLTLLNNHTPHACDTPAIRAAARHVADAITTGSRPEMIWHNVRLRKDDDTIVAQSLRITFHPSSADPGRIDMTAKAEGITSSQKLVTPSAGSIEVELPARAVRAIASGKEKVKLVKAGETLDVRSIRAVYGESVINGHGMLHSAEDWTHSSGQLHLDIRNIDDLMSVIRERTSSGIASALAIARLMAHRDGEQTSWDIGLSSGVVSINNIPLPIPLH